MPQIDYLVKFEKQNLDDIENNVKKLIKNFCQTQLWKEMRYDYMGRLLETDKMEGVYEENDESLKDNNRRLSQI